MKTIDKHFNKQLKAYFEETLQGSNLSLGFPSESMQKMVGLANAEIIITKGTLREKLSKHRELNYDVLSGLPSRIHKPMLIFKSDSVKDKNAYVFVTDKIVDGKPIITAIYVKNAGRLNHIQVNEIASVYAKTVSAILAWLKEGNLLVYIDKKKVQQWLSNSGSNCPQSRQITELISKLINTTQDSKQGLSGFKKEVKKILSVKTFMKHPKIKYIQRPTTLSGIMSGKYAFKNTLFVFEQNDSNMPFLELSGALYLTKTEKRVVREGYQQYPRELEMQVTAGEPIFKTKLKVDLKRPMLSKADWREHWRTLWIKDIETQMPFDKKKIDYYPQKGFEKLSLLLTRQGKVFDSYIEAYKSKKALSPTPVININRLRIVKAKAQALKLKLMLLAA